MPYIHYSGSFIFTFLSKSQLQAYYVGWNRNAEYVRTGDLGSGEILAVWEKFARKYIINFDLKNKLYKISRNLKFFTSNR